MPADKKASAPKPRKERASIPPLVYVLVAAVALGAAGVWYLNRPPAGQAQAPLTGAAKAYVRNLTLSGVDMQAHESYLHQQIVEITGKVGNTGDRVLGAVEIYCVFYDAYGQVVLRRRLPIVSKKMGRLAPGDLKDFRLAFDDLPESWNQALPQLVIASIDFA